jgi:hypothetical protein
MCACITDSAVKVTACVPAFPRLRAGRPLLGL